ncbi:hypothetical protein [Halalkalibacter nanhaiisediminis]|uniref:Uncharacterized protein n=1 Tax=Halalkalibacter nanhaiisediminis TaxID=688079 RepID=A0A562QMX0_9BACI|nr:hypothetical protein [Halalkalibacter nanhaiisediminis]TWI58023.1 hypothetical protein IQ10_01354 [Halalkalibacter nanhaiisediminis]
MAKCGEHNQPTRGEVLFYSTYATAARAFFSFQLSANDYKFSYAGYFALFVRSNVKV